MAVDDWKFEDAPNTISFTVRSIVEGRKPVLAVSLDEEGWAFYTGEPVDMAEAVLVTLRSVVERDPTLNALSELAMGWSARREHPGGQWTFLPTPAE